MIQPVTTADTSPVTPAAQSVAARAEDFKSALDARRARPAHAHPILAQYLLGIGSNELGDRQKRQDQSPASISDISSLAIADLRTPQISARTEPFDATREGAAEERPRSTGNPQTRSGQQNPPQAQQTSADQTQSSVRSNATMSSAEAETPRAIAQQSSVRSSTQAGHSDVLVPSAGAHPGPAVQPSATAGAQPVRAVESVSSNARQDTGTPTRSFLTESRTHRGTPTPASPRSAQQPSFESKFEDEQKFAAQLSRGLAAALRQGGGTVTMRLHPESLGSLTIRMDLHAGRVGASFEVQSDQARQLLNENMTTLRTALEARGMDVERLDVRLAEPMERNGGMHTSDAGPRQHQSGGAGDDDQHQRWEAPGSADGGAAGNHHSPERENQESALEVPQNPSTEMRLWLQQVEMGGAQIVRLRLDAVA